MENQNEPTENNEPTQVPESNDNLLANMLNSIMSQAVQNDTKVQNDDDESDSDSDDDSDDENDDKWVALQKLLDSHLRITKCLLRMIKEK